jgi:UDP:flavonoid glycosyltransferase YjiC (YdhE family)
MATILACTSPALGHLLPISALLSELSRLGHSVHVRTLSTGVEIGQRLGFTTDAIDPCIEGIEQDDRKATNPRAALKLSVAVFGRRAVHEVADLADAVTRVHPDALLVDVNCWGAPSAAEAGDIPWAWRSVSASTPRTSRPAAAATPTVPTSPWWRWTRPDDPNRSPNSSPPPTPAGAVMNQPADDAAPFAISDRTSSPRRSPAPTPPRRRIRAKHALRDHD